MRACRGGKHGDDPERDADTSPAEEREPGQRDVDSPAVTPPAETRGREEYYEALRAADRRMAAGTRVDRAASFTVTEAAASAEVALTPVWPSPARLSDA